MGREDWYRNTEWSAATEAAFRAKLSRSRSSRSQYLRIQALYLASRCPSISLGLINEYFETGDEFDVSMAYCARAEAHCALGNVDDAIVAYKRALAWEQDHPNHFSPARVNFPKLVADNFIASEYDCVLDILTSRFQASDHMFPSARYLWNGTCALISHELGNIGDAREFAERALRAAAETESPFRYHRQVGVVRDVADEFGRRVQRIARPADRSLFQRLLGRWGKHSRR